MYQLIQFRNGIESEKVAIVSPYASIITFVN